MCRMNRNARGVPTGPDQAAKVDDCRDAAAAPGDGGGAGVVQGSRRGVTYLMYACQQADVDAVRSVLHVQGRAAATRRDRTGKSALHYCCTSKSRARAAQAADLLTMAAPELVDGRDEDGFTPLHLAVIAGNMPLVTFLLASHADIRAMDAEQHSVVHWATVCGETEALRAVLQAGAPISTPDVHGGYPLHYAAQMCATPQEKDNELGLVILQTLLSHSKIDVTVRDGDGRQPLLWAASAGSPKAMLALIRAGAPVEASDKDGLTALHCAASRGHTECLDTLLTLCGASVDVIDSNGCTALHYAVTLGHADATALLLAHGANANRQDRKGRTPAHCGCAKGQIETLKILAMHNANLWLRNARGDLPLHEASGSGRRDLVQWLLDAKPSNVNARNNDGRCPLHLAALNDNADMCKILIDHGALINPILRTSKNVFMTPLDCALQKGFRSTAKYLQLQGALPASKLGHPGTIQVNIHENITLDISQSTDDESMQEVEEKKKKATRKKRVDKSAKQRAPDLAVVNTEVTISEHNLNIQASKSLKMGNGRQKEITTQEISIQKSGEKPARTTVRAKTKKDTPDPRKKNTIIAQTQTQAIDTSPIRINENIKEINTLAQSIEAKAKSICQEVNNIETNLDQTSLTSFEEGQQSQQFVVEAAVHPPPSIPSKQDQKKLDEIQQQQKEQEAMQQQYQDVIKSLKDELDAMKQEIKNLKRVEIHASEAAANGKAGTAASDVSDTLKELKVLLEGRVKEIKETVEDFKEDVKTAIGKSPSHQAEKLEEESDGQKIDMELIRGLEKKVKELEKAAEKMQQDVKQSQSGESTIESRRGSAVRSRSSSGRKRTKRLVEEDKIEVLNETEHGISCEQIQEAEKIAVEMDIASPGILGVEELNQEEIKAAENADTPAVEQVSSKDPGVEQAIVPEETSDLQETPAPVIESIVGAAETIEDGADLFGETIKAQTREDMLKLTSEIEAKLSEPLPPDEPTQAQGESVDSQNAPEDDASARAFEILQSTVDENPISIDEIPPDIDGDHAKAFEVLPQSSAEITPDTMQLEKSASAANIDTNAAIHKESHKQIEEKAFEVLDSETSPDPVQRSTDDRQSSPDETKKRFLKSEKRDHHLHLPRDEQLESSIDDANSESSFSSTATKREHKSFTVIQPQIKAGGKTKGMIPKTNGSTLKKKLRSRSEEKRKNQENLNRFPRNTVPVDVTDSDSRRRAKSNLESRASRVPVLPDLRGRYKTKSETNIATMEEFSDEEDNEDTTRKRIRRRGKSRASKSAGSDYESSNLIDSGFEPSPRSTRIPKWRNVSDRGVNMTSVTQSIQGNIRRYHLERKIFQQLLDLKRLQIRAGQHNEHMLVKRAIDIYHRTCAATVGEGRYVPKDYTFKSFEKFLYESLRKIQKTSAPEYLKGLPESATENPMFCTQSTNRCMHATHAYTGIPCAAYLPKMDHHTIPKIGYNSTACKPQGFLPDINRNKAVTLELCHGNDKQIISLPTDRLDQNKRYYVTFTVKGESDETPPPENVMSEKAKTPTHQHSKSM